MQEVAHRYHTYPAPSSHSSPQPLTPGHPMPARQTGPTPVQQQTYGEAYVPGGAYDDAGNSPGAPGFGVGGSAGYYGQPLGVHPGMSSSSPQQHHYQAHQQQQHERPEGENPDYGDYGFQPKQGGGYGATGEGRGSEGRLGGGLSSAINKRKAGAKRQQQQQRYSDIIL